MLFILANIVGVSVGAIVLPPKLPAHWASVGPALESESINVVVQVAQRNIELLKDTALSVSDPRSPRYGQFLSSAEISAMTAPSPADTEAVARWLSPACTFAKVDHATGIIRATLNVKDASTLLDTKFSRVHNGFTDQQTLRAGEYSVPQGVANKIDAIFGLHGLPTPPKSVEIESFQPPIPSKIPAALPDVITKAYKISGKASGSEKVRQAVAEFQGQTMNQTDVETFFQKYVPDAPAKDATVYAFHGEPKQGGDGIEAMLDIEFIMGVAPGVKTEFYEQMNMDFCADLKNWTSLLLSEDDAPLVHSVSYGWQGNLTQIGCKEEEYSDVDNEFAKLAAAGITIIFASGDSGSGFAPKEPPHVQCTQNPGEQGSLYKGEPTRTLKLSVPKEVAAELCCNIAGEEGGKYWSVVPQKSPPPPPGPPRPPTEMINCEIFSGEKPKMHKSENATSGSVPSIPPSPPNHVAPLWPSWPASSPWVTAVGATRFLDDKVGNGEAAVSIEDHFGSGGGFSSMFDAPEWQKKAVSKYFDTVDPSTLPDPKVATYTKTGRATPDVGALGTGYTLIVHGQVQPGVGGTSASAPVFASLISLINDARVKAGKKPMGFLNPFIYQNEDAFYDVTVGSNKVGRGGMPFPAGFNCSKGWDPVTGVGTPIYPALLKAAMAK
jgi:tripeptidyl-peptidase-1